MADKTLLSLSRIKKSFGSVRALSGVDFTLNANEVHALIGENGAGKSTLMKILSGIYPDQEFEGEIFVQQQSALQQVKFKNTLDSEASGIALIHQELSVFLDLSVAENMVVGHWKTHLNSLGLINSEKIRDWSNHWLKMLGARFDSSVLMSSLSIGEQQIVEIAKAVSRNSKVLILDEPTSSLTQSEIAELFKVIRNLRNSGCGLIYISHRMEEIFELSDRVTVLRDGASVFSSEMKSTTPDELIRHMVGRTIDQFYPPKKESSTDFSIEPNLSLENFRATIRGQNKTEIKKIEIGPISLQLKKSEIVGLSGLLGAGRSELVQALCGDERFATEGRVVVRGSDYKVTAISDAFHSGIGYVHEDRKNQSIFPFRSLEENASILRLNQKNMLSICNPVEETNRAVADLALMKTRFHKASQDILDLSGGNQQKVVFARVLQNMPDVIILDEPTRGVDVGAKFEIYQILREWTAQGKSILMISSDLPELIGMCDRILVMSAGKITGELTKPEFNQTKIMQFALQNM